VTVSAYTVRARNLAPDSDNKIHDDEVARRFGFTGALVPGVEVFAYATQPLAAAHGEDFLRRGRLEIQFRKPVYDGDDVQVVVTDDGSVSVVGPDGSPRAVGRGGLEDVAAEVDRTRFVETPAIDPTPAADATSLAVGTSLGTVRETATPEGCAAYIDGICDPLPLYEKFVHPGALLRMVNAVLFRNVVMGPWIHTGSACRLLGPAAVGSELTGYGVVTDRYERNGKSWVRFDALVLAVGEPVALVDHMAIYDLGDNGH
jgi:acyl dehydratase